MALHLLQVFADSYLLVQLLFYTGFRRNISIIYTATEPQNR